MRQAILAARQLYYFEDFAYLAVNSGAGFVPCTQTKSDVFFHGQVRKKTMVLKHDYRLPVACRHQSNVAAVKLNPSRARSIETGN